MGREIGREREERGERRARDERHTDEREARDTREERRENRLACCLINILIRCHEEPKELSLKSVRWKAKEVGRGRERSGLCRDVF